MKKYITQLGAITLLIFLFLGTTSISVLAQHAHPPKDPYNKPNLWLKIEQSPHEVTLWTEYMGKSWQELSYNERLKVKMWIQDMWLNQLSTKNAVIAVVNDKEQTKDEFVENVVLEENEIAEEKEEVINVVVKNQEEDKGETVEKVEQKEKINEVQEGKEELVKTNLAEENKELKTASLTTQKLTRQSLTFDVAERDPIYQKVLEKPKVRVFIKDLTEVVLAEPMDMVELKEDLFGNFLIIEDYYRESFAEYEIQYVYYAQKYPLGGFSEARWVSRHDQQLKALKAKRLNTLKRKFLDKQLTASTN
jgi:hypothetical protein